ASRPWRARAGSSGRGTCSRLSGAGTGCASTSLSMPPWRARWAASCTRWRWRRRPRPTRADPVRYRPYGPSGAAVSSLTLSLGVEAAARGGRHVRDLVVAALEAGVNAYHFERPDPILLQAAGEDRKSGV